MDERREADVVRDTETGRVTGYVERAEHVPVRERIIERPVKKGGAGWLVGLLIGAVIVAGGFAVYAVNQGGFEQAGAQVDQELAEAETAGRGAAETLGDQAEAAGDSIERATN